MKKINVFLTSLCYFCASTALCIENKKEKKVYVRTEGSPIEGDKSKTYTLWPLAIEQAQHSSVLANITEDLGVTTEPIPLPNVKTKTFKHVFDLISILPNKDKTSTDAKQIIRNNLLKKINLYLDKTLADICETTHYLDIPLIENAIIDFTSEKFAKHVDFIEKKKYNHHKQNIKNTVNQFPYYTQNQIAKSLSRKSKILKELAQNIINKNTKKFNIPHDTISLHGNTLISRQNSLQVFKLWNTKNGKLIKELDEQRLFIHQVDDKKSFLIGNNLRVLNLLTGEISNSSIENNKPITYGDIHGNRLVLQLSKQNIKIFALNTKTLLNEIEDNTENITSTTIEKNRFILGSADGTIKIWDLNTCKPTNIIKAHRARIVSVCASNNTLVSGSYDRMVKIWNLETGKLVNQLNEARNSIISVNLIHNKIVASDMVNTYVWDFNTGKMLHKFNASFTTAHRTKNKIITADYTNDSINLIDAKTSNLDATLIFENSRCVTGNNKKIIAGDNTSIKIWNTNILDFFENKMKLKQAILLTKLYATYKRKKQVTLSTREKETFNSLPISLQNLLNPSNWLKRNDF